MSNFALAGLNKLTAVRWPIFLLVFFSTAGILAIQHRDFYFRRPVEAFGDFAANALAIRNAGNLEELHGNYSRWRFNHPGPVFFYVEAAGERLFFKWLRLCPAPHNAQAFSAMLFQVFFWALAIALLSSYVPSAVHLGLIWIAGWAHFHSTCHAFVSVWPPHTLLMPFLCFCIACASVSSGCITHLWILIPTGLVLIHNHVAQPLSVALLGVCGITLLISRDRTTWIFPRRSLFWWWVAICLVPTSILILPLFLDLLLGSQGNYRAILDHLSRHGNDTKSVLQSLHYFLEFSRYWKFDAAPTSELFGEFKARPAPIVLWTLVVILALWRVLAPKRMESDGKNAATYNLFLRSLAIVSGAAVISAILWGMRMSGDMFAFNGFYFYSIFFLPLIIGACGIADLFVIDAPVIRRAVYAGAITLPFLMPVRPILSDVPNGNLLRRKIEVLSDQKILDIGEPIILLSAADRGLDAAAVANILEALGSHIAVPKSWLFLFGKRFALETLTFGGKVPRLWAITSEGKAPINWSIDLGQGIWLVRPPITVDLDVGPWGTSFGPEFQPFISGFATDASNPPWSIGSEGDIILPVVPTASDVEITLDVHSLEGPINNKPRRVIVEVNGQRSVAFSVQGRQLLQFTISRDLWNTLCQRWGVVPLHFQFLDPITPKECGINDDPRPLSVAFHSLKIEKKPYVRTKAER